MSIWKSIWKNLGKHGLSAIFAPILGNALTEYDNDYTGRASEDDKWYTKFVKGLNNMMNPKHDWFDYQSWNDAGSAIASKITGSALTPAEREANAFSAEEAEKARQWEEYMSSTSYQRQVTDMQKAGINPALAMTGGASGASTPSSPAPSSVAPASGMNMSDLMQLIMLPLNMKMMKAQIGNVDASTQNTIANTKKVGFDIDEIKSRIRGLDISNEQQEVILKYLDRSQQAQLRIQELSADRIDADIDHLNASIDKMDAERLAVFVEMCETYERINVLFTEQQLNVDQARYYAKLCSNLDKQNQVLDLTIDDWDYINVVGTQSANGGFGPFKVGESRPVTLGELKKRAEKVADAKTKGDGYEGKSWQELKDEARSRYGALE